MRVYRNRRKWKRRQYELRRVRRLSLRHRRRKSLSSRKQDEIYQLVAPVDFRLLKNTSACVRFFNLMRSMKNAISMSNGQLVQRIDLSRVKHVDFASTIMLGAIGDELKQQIPSCICPGRLPIDKSCAKYFRDSGFLNSKVNAAGKPFGTSSASDSMTFERGHTKLKVEEMKRITAILRHTALRLLGEERINYRHTIMIKEICANTVRWSKAFNSQWIFGAKYEDDKVVFVALDLGCGILESLYRNYLERIRDRLFNITDEAVLEGAFDKKYQSASEERNRNLGLPSIKQTQIDGYIRDLQVLSNNVLLDFSDSSKSKVFMPNKQGAFNGTLYSWRIFSDCYK